MGVGAGFCSVPPVRAARQQELGEVLGKQTVKGHGLAGSKRGTET